MTKIFLFQPNNLNVVVSEQNQDQMVEDRLTELEEKKSTYFMLYAMDKNILKFL